MISLKTTIATPVWFYVLIFSFLLIVLIFFIIFTWKLIKQWISDKLIFFDKNGRWTLIHQNIKGMQTYSYKNKTYYLSDKISMLSSRGKALYIFTENKPEPLNIEHGKVKWLDGESLQAIIDNKVIQQIVKPSEKFKDIMMLIGAVAGMLACISSFVVLLVVTGVLKVQ